METNLEPKSFWDRIISKYISIWIWSIIFGVNATITFSLVQVIPGREWGILVLAPVMIMLYGFILILFSWHYIYKYLKEYIIPRYFPLDNEELDVLKLNQSAGYLLKAFRYMMYAAFITILVKIIQTILFAWNPL